jgi:hypothetical protein
MRLSAPTIDMLAAAALKHPATDTLPADEGTEIDGAVVVALNAVCIVPNGEV